jgi:diaminopimelate epimerase
VRHLGDRRFGVGADQILVVEPARTPGVDFRYRIFNNTGDEVEHCGNGARCFVRFVHDQGLDHRRHVRVETVNNLLELRLAARRPGDGGHEPAAVRPGDPVPFDATGLQPRCEGGFELWPLDLATGPQVEVAVLSMGNPHAVLRVDDVRDRAGGRAGPLHRGPPTLCRAR